jgi:membrane protein implicated in regulation of membrane protease activity
MGLRESPVPYVTLSAGFVGLAAAIALTGGLSVFQYPIHVGGKALFSWQAFVPIFFELFVLFAALATMGSVVFFCGLGKWHSPLHDSNIMPEIMCDRFAIVLETEDGGPPVERLREMLIASGCEDIRPLEEIVDEDDSII